MGQFAISRASRRIVAGAFGFVAMGYVSNGLSARQCEIGAAQRIGNEISRLSSSPFACRLGRASVHIARPEHRLLASSIRRAIGMVSSLDIERPVGLAIWSRCRSSTDNERERRANAFLRVLRRLRAAVGCERVVHASGLTRHGSRRAAPMLCQHSTRSGTSCRLREVSALSSR